MTPKERLEKLELILEEGGDEALSRFLETNPDEFLKAIEAFYILNGDDEGLDEIIRLARELGDNETADKIESLLK